MRNKSEKELEQWGEDNWKVKLERNYERGDRKLVDCHLKISLLKASAVNESIFLTFY